MTHAWWVSAAVLGLLCSTGCKKVFGNGKQEPSEEDKKRAAFLAGVEAKQIAQAEQRLQDLSALKGKLPPPQDGPVTLGTEWNKSLWINEANLADPTGDPSGVDVEDAKKTTECALETRRPPFNTRRSQLVQRCGEARYAFVIRIQQKKAPYITEYGSKEKQGEFMPGVATGDVVVFDLTDKKAIGGFRWKATSSDSVQKVWMQKDFEANVRSAVEVAAATAVKHL